jgi:O-6-methylguanine DNA methyltransferase
MEIAEVMDVDVISRTARTPISIGHLEIPRLGPGSVTAAATPRGVCRVWLRGETPPEAALWRRSSERELLSHRPGCEVREGGALIDDFLAEVEDYFSGRLRRFRSPADLDGRGTPFQRRVWEALRRIPYGRTLSYGEVAARVGRPRAFRAVGQANGRNPIPLIVPCHRVIAAAGRLGGFGAGLELKRTLLEIEGISAIVN